MRKTTLTLTALATLLALLVGCQMWNPGGVPFTDKDGAFTVRVPADWMFATAFGNDFTASKEGVILQQIVVEHRELKESLKNSKRMLTAALAPLEVAEAYADDLRSNHALLAFEIKENTPAQLGSQPGFHLVYSFRTEEKLRLTEECYGCIISGKLWLLRYRAPSRHYFESDRAVFAETARTFQFGKSETKPAR